ncbi:bifunctional riboflavin kinase/FAD synthetase [Blastococcus sp. Marseille-P5729]|uniref:bifunctional riboflavin kinase/FAD synthetase n=1 Tax=Blastococcus sp. Marseille-P5729 TaxID=2086582 RepID=UPI000D107893|nr:bifunctional riboflavin kinase/FAD synthetase [Blastococcus sp. Marseille-P5729]
MLRWRRADNAPAGWGQSVMSIGQYDGVHLGHRALLGETVRQAREAGLPALVMTFDPHPREVLKPGTHPPILTPLRRKAELIEECGVDALCVVPFTQSFAKLSPQEFVHEVLVAHLHPQKIIVGENFTFGNKAAGNVQVLAELGRTFGFEVEAFGLVNEGPHTISSTYIRACVDAGDMRKAAAALGRPHRIEGLVVRGDMRGRGLGFPTANLRPPMYSAIPADGVYAGWMTVREQPRAAAVSVGTNPTYSGTERRVESYLLDFEGDLYGEQVQIDFVERLRGMERFESSDDLVDAIQRDVAATRTVLGDLA